MASPSPPTWSAGVTGAAPCGAVRKLGTRHGGKWVDGIHFSFAGGQVRSLLSLLSYVGKGADRERYLGLKIPPTNLKPEYLLRAHAPARGGQDHSWARLRRSNDQP